jgi:hypothetical protein
MKYTQVSRSFYGSADCQEKRRPDEMMAFIQRESKVNMTGEIHQSSENLHFLRRGFAVWCFIIFVESLHGIAREIWLRPLVGDFRARQIAFFSGMILILTVALIFVRWLRTQGKEQLLHVGLLWMVLTLLFEFSLGRLVLGYSWQRMFADYNLARGGLMGLGLLWMLCAPLLAARLRGLLTLYRRQSDNENNDQLSGADDEHTPRRPFAEMKTP